MHGGNRLGASRERCGQQLNAWWQQAWGQQKEVWSAVECMVATGLGPAERGVVSS